MTNPSDAPESRSVSETAFEMMEYARNQWRDIAGFRADAIKQMEKTISLLEAENAELRREPYIQKQQAERIVELETRLIQAYLDAGCTKEEAKEMTYA